MHQYLLSEFLKPIFDVATVANKIASGKPKKVFVVFAGTPEPLGLFTPDQNGRNIFHHLAMKGQLGNFLETFFGPGVSNVMLKREGGGTTESLKRNIKELDKDNSSVLQIMAIYEPYSVAKLSKYGIDFTGNDLEFTTNFCIKFVTEDKSDLLSPQYKGAAEIFLQNAIIKGEEVVLKEYNGKQLYPHLPFIEAKVKELTGDQELYPAALRIFTNIFQRHWPEIFSHTKNVQDNMAKILSLSQLVQTKLENSLSLNEWAGLFGVPVFENIEQVKEYILAKCAESFLAGTLLDMTFDNLIVNAEAIVPAQLEMLQAAALPPITVDEVDKSYVIVSPVKPEGAASKVAPADSEDQPQSPVTKKPAATVLVPKIVETAAVFASAPPLGMPTNTKLNANPPSDKTLRKSLSISELEEIITQVIETDPDLQKDILADLGHPPYKMLHVFLVVLNTNDEYFDKILNKIAMWKQTLPMSGEDFLAGYVAKLTSEDIIATTLITITHAKKALNGFGLACVIKNTHLASLLFNQGLKLGVYKLEAINSVLESAMRYNAPDIMKVLLEKPDVTIDWYYLILQAMKHCNGASKFTVDYYVNHPELGTIMDVQGREGEIQDNPKFNVLNKILFNLDTLAKWSVQKEGVDKSILNQSVKKLFALSALAEQYLLSEKVYYAEDNLWVSGRTLRLLESLVQDIRKIPENRTTEPSISAVKELIDHMVDNYKALKLTDRARSNLEKLEKYIEDDESGLETGSARSVMTTDSKISHFSALSFDDRDQDLLEELEYMNTSGAEAMELVGEEAAN